MVTAIRTNDDHAVESALVALSRKNRLLAPLGLLLSGFMALFQGLVLLVTNWRLTLIQLLPATLIWAAMVDFKVHVFKGRSFGAIRGPVVIPIVLFIAALTAAAYYLNGVFAFYVSEGGEGRFTPAFDEAARHRRAILGWGFVVGLALGFATTVSARWGRGWFALILGAVVAVMMVTYVAVPAGMVGVRTKRSRRSQITTGAVGGAVGAVVCTPPYTLGRFGIVLLGVHSLFVVGLVLLIFAVPLQVGAVTATKAVKLSSKLLEGKLPETDAVGAAEP